MPRFRRLPAVLGVMAVVLVVFAVLWGMNNPTVSSTSLGEYMCTAPYDTVLNDADNMPGGEPPPDGEVVEDRCIDAGEQRFTEALLAGGAAILLGVAAALLAVRQRSA